MATGNPTFDGPNPTGTPAPETLTRSQQRQLLRARRREERTATRQQRADIRSAALAQRARIATEAREQRATLASDSLNARAENRLDFIKASKPAGLTTDETLQGLVGGIIDTINDPVGAPNIITGPGGAGFSGGVTSKGGSKSDGSPSILPFALLGVGAGVIWWFYFR